MAVAVLLRGVCRLANVKNVLPFVGIPYALSLRPSPLFCCGFELEGCRRTLVPNTLWVPGFDTVSFPSSDTSGDGGKSDTTRQ